MGNFYNIIVFIFFFVFINITGSAQIFRYRLSGSSSMFISELGPSEIEHPQTGLFTYPGSSDFNPGFKLGAEVEIMVPVTSNFELGIEFDFTNLAGYTETAPLYNFFLTARNPLAGSDPYPDEALIYTTKQLSALGTSRLYFFSIDNDMNIFAKALAGVTFTGTDFTFDDPFYRVEYGVGVLYARGTKNSEYPKKAAFSGGAGLGITYKISDKLDICLDGTALLINSDIVNGVPNFNYTVISGMESFEPALCWSMVGQITIGIIYSAIRDQRLNRSRYTKSRKIKSNIFWKRKRTNPFSKRR